MKVLPKRSGRGCEIEELSGVVEIEGELVEGDGSIALIHFPPTKLGLVTNSMGRSLFHRGILKDRK